MSGSISDRSVFDAKITSNARPRHAEGVEPLRPEYLLFGENGGMVG
jgi:hypothetical protein